MSNFEISNLSINQLLADPNNYRFQDDEDFVVADERRFAEETVQNRAYRKLRDESLIALKNSIIQNGYIPVEPIVVRNYAQEKGKYIVVEGNRRTAAMKWIIDDHNAGVAIPDRVLNDLENIPVVIVSNETDPSFYESLMGIRHVSGIKQWGGYQRAKLVAVLKDEKNLSTEEVGKKLGMSPREVNRRYKAFKALEQMKTSEDFSEYARPNLYPVFHEAVSIPVVREWLKWDDTESQFEESDLLNQFYSLLSPYTNDDEIRIEPKLKTYADIRELQNIIPNSEALSKLLDPTQKFFDAVAEAKQEEMSKSWLNKLKSAHASLMKIDYRDLKDLDNEQLKLLKDVKDLIVELTDAYDKLKS